MIFLDRPFNAMLFWDRSLTVVKNTKALSEGEFSVETLHPQTLVLRLWSFEAPNLGHKAPFYPNTVTITMELSVDNLHKATWLSDELTILVT